MGDQDSLMPWLSYVRIPPIEFQPAQRRLNDMEQKKKKKKKEPKTNINQTQSYQENPTKCVFFNKGLESRSEIDFLDVTPISALSERFFRTNKCSKLLITAK